MREKWLPACLVLVALASPAWASQAFVAEAMEQGAVQKNNTNDSVVDWWYGCSPTSAGMMMAYYDRNGYGGLDYSNLVPGGVAEASTFGDPGAILNDIIASQEHQADFYNAATYGYDTSGDGGNGYLEDLDDVGTPRARAAFNSLADFMGTSQDSGSNKNGSTTFWNWSLPSNARYTAADALAGGKVGDSGMYGIKEYIEYAGYGVSEIYNQRVDTVIAGGFSFNDFVAEIDAGRVVMIHVTGHSMYGYGYDDASSTIYFYDTWDANEHSMTWGGQYATRDLLSVTAFTLTGGAAAGTPEPATMVLVLVCVCALFAHERRLMPVAA